jgi:hypothetical protein
MAGNVTFDLVDDKVHIYSSNPDYSNKALTDESQSKFEGYVGSFTVENKAALAA